MYLGIPTNTRSVPLGYSLKALRLVLGSGSTPERLFALEICLSGSKSCLTYFSACYLVICIVVCAQALELFSYKY